MHIYKFIPPFQAVAWAKSLIKKDKNKEKISGLNEGETLRSKLGEALHRIRFATMSEKEFAEFVGNKINKKYQNLIRIQNIIVDSLLFQFHLAYFMKMSVWT